MDKLIFRVMEETGLPEDKARAAVVAVIGYVKQRLPNTAARDFEAVVSGDADEPKIVDRKKKFAALAATTPVNVQVLPRR